MTEERTSFEEARQKQKKNFSLIDSIIALAVFFIGYLISCWTLFGNGQGLGMFIILALMAAVALIYLKAKNIHVTKSSYISLCVILILALPLFISADPFIKFLVMSYAEISLIYWFFTASGNREDNEINDMLFFDIIKSALVLPFSCVSDIFGAISSFIKRSSFGKKALLIIAGIAIAIVPTAIVTVLLISADEAFSNLSKKLFDGIFKDIPETILYFCFGVPVSMYIYGLLFAGVTHEKKECMTRKKNEKTASLFRFLPSLLTCAAITPIILVYILFFFSQTSYFLSAFSGIRPENITFAEYARKGFFELCSVSVINMLIIIVANALTKRNENKPSKAVSVYITTLSVFTLALIAIALSKMFMYIDAYGLSRLRVYTTWFMAILALIFVFTVIKQFAPRFNFAKTLVIAFTVMFAMLVFGDTDALIARYNIHCYETGKFDSVDIYMMYELSDSVVPYVIDLADDDDPYVAAKAKEYLKEKAYVLEKRDNAFANFNMTTYKARKAIEEYQRKIKE